MTPNDQASYNSYNDLFYAEDYATQTHLANMSSDEKDELIEELYHEITRLRRVLYALITERDQGTTAACSHNPGSKSEPKDNLEAYVQSRDEDASDSEVLVSDDTLRGSESDSSDSSVSPDCDTTSILYPTRRGTPCSAPPHITSFPNDDVLPSSYKRERRLSLPSTQSPKDDFDSCYSINYYDEAFDETFIQEEDEPEVNFPRVDNIYAQTPDPQAWRTEPLNGSPPKPRLRKQAKVESDYLSFSSLWQATHEVESESEYSVQTTSTQIIETSETLVVITSDFSSSSEFVDIDLNDDHEQSGDSSTEILEDPIEEDSQYEFGISEERPEVTIDITPNLLISNKTHFLNNIYFEMPRPRTGWEKYTRRIFSPSLPIIPEIGDFLITFPASEPCLVSVTTGSVVLSIDDHERCVSPDLDFTSFSQTKKSWFDMIMEEEDEFC